jgi:gluconate 2-dehydrogenase gamma chain
MTGIRRRDWLTGTALVLVVEKLARAEVISGKLPWRPDAGSPPHAAQPPDWSFFSDPEAATMEALVDRLIPPDPQTPGGKSAVFIDRKLAGGYGHNEGLYSQGPFQRGVKQQGPQSAQGPADLYRAGS